MLNHSTDIKSNEYQIQNTRAYSLGRTGANEQRLSGNQAIIKKIKYYQKLLGDLRGLNNSSHISKSRRQIIKSMSPVDTKINTSSSFIYGKTPLAIMNISKDYRRAE